MASFLQNMVSYYNENFSAYSSKILTIIIILVIGYIAIKIITKLIARFFDRVDFDRGVETFIENASKVILWIVLLIILLSNLGVNVTGLLAGLGIMGIIVGFALQDTLGNLASGVFILFHKPFRVGDTVNIAGIVGTVDKVGISACEFTSPDKVKITIPNRKIWGDVIQNYTSNPTRTLFNLDVGISYGSDISKAIKVIKDIFREDKRVYKDPEPQIVIKSLGDSAIVITARPTVSNSDYWPVYFDSIRKIKEEFDRNGIVIPFPQREIWIKDQEKAGKQGSGSL